MRASAALVLDRLAELLADDLHLVGGDRFAVSHAGETEEIGRKLRAAGMEDEASAHAEHAAEQAGFEDDIVSRRGLTGLRFGGSGRADGGPVVLREHEGGKVDLAGKLDEAFQRGDPGIEARHPGFDIGDLFETACQHLQQLRLLSRRAQEYARLVHPVLPLAGRGPAPWILPQRPGPYAKRRNQPRSGQRLLGHGQRLFGQRLTHRASLHDPLEIAEQAG